MGKHVEIRNNTDTLRVKCRANHGTRISLFLFGYFTTSNLLQVTIIGSTSPTTQGPRFVQEPPRYRLDFSNTTGTVLPCVAQGSPVPTIQWLTVGGASATDVPGLRHIRPDGSLVFLPFRAEEYRADVHDATYRCAATNEVGTVLSREIRVRGVVQQPYAVDVYDEFVVRGNTAVLRCRVPAQVQDYVTVTSWIRDGSFVIRPTALAGDRFSIFDSGELHIRRVDHGDGLQQYRCETRHKLTGENVLSATAGRLLVTETFREAAPRIMSSQRLLRVSEGGTLEAPCAAQGYPPPSYEWFRRNKEGLSPLQHFGNRMLQLEGTLLIRDARSEDSGQYLCKVSNTKGEDSAETEILVTAPLLAQVLPKSLSVDVGRSTSFNCSITGQPVSSVQWMKDGRNLRPGPGLEFPSRDRVRITAVRRQDAGMYQCFVSNDLDSAQGTAQLTLGDYPPTLLDTFSEETISPGGPLSLKCVAQGRPLPQITWSLDGSPVPDSGARLRMGDYVRPGGQVVSYVNVSSVKPEDGGQYACAAENSAGRTAHAVRINIVGPPFVRPMANKSAVAGDTLELTCPVGGHPIATIRWEKDGVRLPVNHRQKVFPNGTLQVRSVEKTSDGGRYTCIASNADGVRAENSLYVAVLVRPVIDPFTFPRSLQQGQRYSVLCTVTEGDPPVRIRWTKDGTTDLSPDDGKVKAFSVTPYTSTLFFEALSPDQTGNYTCIAENKAGMVSHTSTMVIHVPPRWRIEPTDTSATRGKPVVVDCQADGFPVPRIRWTKAEGDASGEFRPISSSSRLHVFENGSLVVHSVQPEDSGQYLCQANNGVGQGLSKVVRISVHVAAHFENKFRAESVRKGEDARLVCEALGDRPVHMTWLKDKQAFESHSDVRYDLSETVLGESTISTLTIRRADRRDSALYTCIATNAFGRDDTNIQLIMQEPPDAPQDAKVLEFSSRTAKIGWTAPYSGNSPILQYLVHYKEEADRWQQQTRNITVGGSESSIVVRNLLPVTFYQLRVYAENVLGRSEPSSIIHLRTEQEVPGGPPQKVKARATGAHTIKVSWKPPRKELQYGIIEGYYVGYRESGSKDAFIFKTLRAKGEDGTVAASEDTQLSGLKRLTEYTVVVQAYNAKGASPPSDQVVVKTLENDPPGSPNVKVIFTNHSSIGLTWEQTDTENAVQGFIIHHKWELGEWEEIEVPATDTEYALHDLKCGSRYQFYVSAFNAVGRGMPSDVIRMKTDGRAPLAPDKQSLVSANQTCASVNLGAWLDGGCPISEFAVRYRQHKHQQWVSATVTGLAVTLEDLVPASWYRLQVTAHNEAGSTDAEYTFVTSPLQHVPEDDPSPLPSPSDVLPLFLDMNILIPAAISFAVIVVLIALVCVIVHKRPRHHDASQTGDTYSSGSKCGVHSESVPLSDKSSLKKALSDPRSGGYFPTPYATTRVSAEEQQQQKEAASRQALEEPLYATVKRTPRPPRSDLHVYHYPGEMPECFMQTGKDLDALGAASSSSVYWKELSDTKLDCGNSSGQRKSHRYSKR